MQLRKQQDFLLRWRSGDASVPRSSPVSLKTSDGETDFKMPSVSRKGLPSRRPYHLTRGARGPRRRRPRPASAAASAPASSRSSPACGGAASTRRGDTLLAVRVCYPLLLTGVLSPTISTSMLSRNTTELTKSSHKPVKQSLHRKLNE